jgi:hypothetical protein
MAQATKTCSIVGCWKPTVGRGWCRRHYHSWQRYGDPLVRRSKVGWFDHRPHPGSYRAAHTWMRTRYPLTGRCEWCASIEKRTCYASAEHRYTRNRADWLELCYSCHAYFDNAWADPEYRAKQLERLQGLWIGRKHSEATIAKMKQHKFSPEHRARLSEAQKRRYARERAERL